MASAAAECLGGGRGPARAGSGQLGEAAGPGPLDLTCLLSQAWNGGAVVNTEHGGARQAPAGVASAAAGGAGAGVGGGGEGGGPVAGAAPASAAGSGPWGLIGRRAVDYQLLAQWVEHMLPFAALLAIVFAYHFFTGIFLCVWLGCSVAKANEVIRKIVAQASAEPTELAAAVIFVGLNVGLTLWLTGPRQLLALALAPPLAGPGGAPLSVWQVLFTVAITDSLVRCCGVIPKLLIAAATMLPRPGAGVARRVSGDGAARVAAGAAAGAGCGALGGGLGAGVAEPLLGDGGGSASPCGSRSPCGSTTSTSSSSSASSGSSYGGPATAGCGAAAACCSSSVGSSACGGGGGGGGRASRASLDSLGSRGSLDLPAPHACCDAAAGSPPRAGCARRALSSGATFDAGAAAAGAGPSPRRTCSTGAAVDAPYSHPPPPPLVPTPSGRLTLATGARAAGGAPPLAGGAPSPNAQVCARRRARLLALYENVQATYRAALPVPLWHAYLSASTPSPLLGTLLGAAYLAFKAHGLLRRGRLLLLATRLVLRTGALYGRYLSKAELAALDAWPQCPICVDGVAAPIRLDCSHVFCEDCLSEWLEREPTCPMCRATVKPPGLVFGDGATTLLPQLF